MNDMICINIYIKMTGKPNINCINKVFSHQKPSQQLHCNLASILKMLSLYWNDEWDFPSVDDDDDNDDDGFKEHCLTRHSVVRLERP